MLAVYEQTASLQHYLLSTVGVLYYDIHGALGARCAFTGATPS
jgi:hypothetical protein